MPTLIRTFHGKVTGLWGSATIRNPDGSMRELKMGDEVRQGDQILTSQNGFVRLNPEVEPVVSGLGDLDSLEPTAAGVAGGGAGNLLEGLRVDRITESVGPAQLLQNESAAALAAVRFSGNAIDTNQAASSTVTPDVPPTPTLGASSSNITAQEEGAPVELGLQSPTGVGSAIVITVGQVPLIGEIRKSDGTLVTANSLLTSSELVGLTYVPPADYIPGALVGDFTYTVDSDGATATGKVVVGLTATNDAPIAVPSSVVGLEDALIPVALSGTDVDGSITGVTITSLPSGSTLLLADGITSVSVGQTITAAQAASMLFKPATDFNGDTRIAFLVTDDVGAASTPAQVTVQVTPVNDAPVASNDVVASTEDTPVVLDVLANDQDPEGQVLTITAIAGQPIAVGSPVMLPEGRVELNSNGTLSFTPAPNFNGPVNFTYTVSDGQASSTAAVTVNVAPVNDVPVAVSDQATTRPNTPVTLTVLANDTDVDGDTLQVSSASVNPAQGSVTVNPDGSLNFTPANNVSGPVVLTYTVVDPSGATSIGSVTVDVGANTPPSGKDTSVTLPEDGRHTFNPADFGFTDADPGQTLAGVRMDTLPATGVLSLNGAPVTPGQVVSVADISNLVFTPAPNENGDNYARFNFSVQDSAGAFDTTPNTLSLNVLAVDDPAVISGTATGNVTEDGTLVASGVLTAADVDGPANVFVPAISTGTYGDFAISADGVWSYTLRNAEDNVQALTSAQRPTESFTVRAADGSAQVVTVTVNGANELPVAVVSPVSTGAEDSSGIPITLTATDVDGRVASFTITALPVSGTLLFNGVPLVIGSDVPATAGGAVLSFVPAANWNGTTTMGFSAMDNEGGRSAPVIQSISVQAVNDVPQAVADAVSTALNTPLDSINVLANDTDVDGDTLQVSSASVNPAQGSVTVNPDGTLNFTPATNVSGPVVVSYTVVDGQGGSSVSTLTINVANNTPPTGTDASLTLPEDGTHTFSPADFGFNDADPGQTLAGVRVDTLPSAGVLSLNGAPVVAGQVISAADISGLVFTPVPNANGNNYAQITFSVQDSAGAFDATPNVLSLNVTPVADTAVVSGTTTGATVEDTTLRATGTLTVTDPDAGESRFVAQAGVAGAHGTFSVNEVGQWVYELNNADPAVQALGAGQFLPAETFTVRTADGTTQLVTVSIAGINDTPDTTSFSLGAKENGALVNGTLSATDVDANAVLSFAARGDLPPGFTLNTNGTYAFDPTHPAYQSLAVGQQQILTLPYTVTDERGATATANLVLTLTGNNSIPVLKADVATTLEDTTLTLAPATLLGNDIDPDQGDVLSLASVQDAVGGTVALNGSGSVVFTPTANYSGPASFTYTVSDGHGGLATTQVAVAITAVADKPTLTASSSQNHLSPGPFSISTEPGITQAKLEAAMGAPAGALDKFSPPAGPAVNDAGAIDVIDGKLTQYTLALGAGHQASFNWQFFNGEDDVKEIADGFNDQIVLVVTDPTGLKQYVPLSSSEQVGPNTNGVAADDKGTYRYTAVAAGEYQFSWLVLNGGDVDKDSSITVSAPTITIDGRAHGVPVALPISAGLTDKDGSETLQVTLSGVPADAELSAGKNLGGGVWSLDPGQWDGLYFYPSVGFSGTVNLSITATATETSNGATASSNQKVTLTIDASAATSLGTVAGDNLGGTDGQDYMQGFAGNDSLNGNNGNDVLHGDAGADVLNGGNGNDTLYGGAGNDTISGNNGNDHLHGGTGSDLLTGGNGADVFVWSLADRAAPGTGTGVPTDTVNGFSLASGATGDRLDLRDLLQGHDPSGINPVSLDRYLDFDTTSSTGNTIIHVSSSGGFVDGQYNAAAEDQRIVLNGVDMRSVSALGLDAGASDADIINQLLQRGNLVTGNGF